MSSSSENRAGFETNEPIANSCARSPPAGKYRSGPHVQKKKKIEHERSKGEAAYVHDVRQLFFFSF
jgi:hypothetical protein